MKICENIHQIKIEFHVTEEIKRYVYLYLITGKYCYLIDTGVAGSERVIENYIKELGRSLSDIKTIFLTHSHPDHIGAAAKIQEVSNCKVVASPREKHWIEDITIQFRERPIPNFYTLVDKSVAVHQTVREGEQIFLEPGLTIRVLETPGHSLGSISYILEESNVIFSGDAIPAPDDFPIFTDEKASVDSLIKIQNQGKFRFCLPAWDKIYKQEEINEILQNRIASLKKLKDCVQKTEITYPQKSEEEKEKMICEYMGWNFAKGNPLFRQSIRACKE